MIPLLAALALALTPQEVAWEQIQIECIPDVHDLNQVLDARQAGLIRLLGHPDYLVRSLATDELIRQGDTALTALCWGTRAKDPEIADAARRLIDRFYRCPDCDGTGHNSRGYCQRCDECGDLRYFRPSYDGVYVERDLFGVMKRRRMWEDRP